MVHAALVAAWCFLPYGDAADGGIAVCTASDDQQLPTVCSDGCGEAIVTWQDERNSDRDIYAQRVTRFGNVGSDPIPVSTFTAVVVAIVLASLGLVTLRKARLKHT